MKNNTFFKNSLLAAAVVMLSSAMVSCDDIAEDDRYVEVEDVTPVRSILIEDFTGQNCLNCPNAHEVIEGLEEKYGDAVVAVSIHAGGLSINRKATNYEKGRVGLATPEGAHYNDLYKVLTYPYGIINGHLSGAFETWTQLAKLELTVPSDLNINLSSKINGSNEVEINVDLMAAEDMDGQLMVWIVENGIVAQQKMPSGVDDKEYVHNNVFRAAVNGEDGENVSLKKDATHHASYSIEVRDNKEEKWNADNLSVVAFLKTANGVEQVKKVKVTR